MIINWHGPPGIFIVIQCIMVIRMIGVPGNSRRFKYFSVKNQHLSQEISFLIFSAIAFAVPPPTQRPVAPRADVAAAARLASAEVRKIDPHYYCISADYVHAFLVRKSNETAFPSRHWRITFSLPGDDLTRGASKDILVLVSEDGKEIRMFKNPAEAIYQI